VAENEAAAAVHGLVAAQIYQGGHIDLYVEVPQAVSGRVLLRVPSHEGASLRPPGTRIAIALAADAAVAFRAA
jgi:putative spermidine/putrescine transport system ATP-binding protein/spermidine/putrescine transport system ATP-binding protein